MSHPRAINYSETIKKWAIDQKIGEFRSESIEGVSMKYNCLCFKQINQNVIVFNFFRKMYVVFGKELTFCKKAVGQHRLVPEKAVR